MPIASVSVEQAFAKLKRFRPSVWPDGRRDSSRLDGIATVSIQPSFSFQKDDPIFTMGSCFAREIENYLQKRGFDLPMLGFSLPRDERVSEQGNDFLNKYTIHSMENEVRWAFEGLPVAPEKLFLSVGDGLWHDPHLAPNLIPASLERVTERRNQTMRATESLTRSGVAVVTLGLAEAWFDEETELYMNGTPPAGAQKAYPGRFSLHVLSYEEILSSLERLYALLKRYGRPDLRMLVTVSPVPFKASFSGMDALTANCYSKSVQRAVCGEFVGRHTDVDYFPSYEIVTLTDRTTAYEIDNIHVKRSVVEKIMASVLKSYSPDSIISEENQQPAAVRIPDDAGFGELIKIAHDSRISRDYELGVQALGKVFKSLARQIPLDQIAQLHLQYGILLMRTGNNEEGFSQVKQSLMYDPLIPTAHYKAGLAAARLKRREEALMFFSNACRLDPDNAEYYWRRGVEWDKMGETHKGKADLQKAVVLDPSHARASEALAGLLAKEAQPVD